MEKILEINQEQLCANCFAKWEDGVSCRRCRSVSDVTGGLPGGTILHGKYIIGGILYYDNSYFGYYGYDLEENERVLIRELFPAGSYCIRSGKELICDRNDQFMYMEYQSVVSGFHTETKLMSGLKESGAVLPVKNLIDENGTSYSIMQFPEKAILLSEYIQRRGGRLDIQEALEISAKIITALDVVHKSGLIHGNIRPENIVLYEKKVLLTGMHYGGFNALENRSSPIYTNLNRYAPLEQFTKSNKRGPWTDIYALGATVYFMLTSRFSANIFSRMDSLEDSYRQPAMDSAAGIPDGLAQILEKMMEIKVDDRYRNLNDLCRALRAAHLINIKIAPDAKEKKKSGRRIRIGIIAGICGLLICGLAVWFLLYHPFENDEQLQKNDGSSVEENIVDADTEHDFTEDTTETDETTAETSDEGEISADG